MGVWIIQTCSIFMAHDFGLYVLALWLLQPLFIGRSSWGKWFVSLIFSHTVLSKKHINLIEIRSSQWEGFVYQAFKDRYAVCVCVPGIVFYIERTLKVYVLVWSKGLQGLYLFYIWSDLKLYWPVVFCSQMSRFVVILLWRRGFKGVRKCNHWGLNTVL